jgi:RNA polymerase sigma-70 factor, ECF subfamily
MPDRHTVDADGVLPMTEETRIISAVLDGEADAFEPLIAKYEKPIYNLMYRTTGSLDDAVELTQEVFLKAYDKLDQFQLGRNFFSWLYALAVNIGRDYLRHKRRHPPSIHDNPGPIAEDLQTQADPRLTEEVQSLVKALALLPIDYREAVILRFQEERSMQEIADMLNLSVSGAKMRVHRGLEKLRAILGDAP